MKSEEQFEQWYQRWFATAGAGFDAQEFKDWCRLAHQEASGQTAPPQECPGNHCEVEEQTGNEYECMHGCVRIKNAPPPAPMTLIEIAVRTMRESMGKLSPLYQSSEEFRKLQAKVETLQQALENANGQKDPE